MPTASASTTIDPLLWFGDLLVAHRSRDATTVTAFIRAPGRLFSAVQPDRSLHLVLCCLDRTSIWCTERQGRSSPSRGAKFAANKLDSEGFLEQPIGYVICVEVHDQRSSPMGEIRDKAGNAAQDAKGKAKEVAGRATGNDRLEAHGKADQTKASAKKFGEKIKDIFR
jgi:uncharacterized protein YjbJ (UPF0337 family)